MNDHNADRLDAVIAAFQRQPVPEPPDPATVLARLAEAGRQGTRSSQFAPPRIRRFFMRPAVRYSTLAVTLLAVLGWFGLNLASAVALAEVVQATQQHTLARYQLEELYDYSRGNASHAGMKRTVYADLTAPRLRLVQRTKTMNDIFDFESVMVQDNTRDRFLKLATTTQIISEDQADANQRLVFKLIRGKEVAGKKAYLYRLTQADGQPFNLDDLIKGTPLLDSLRELQNHPDTRSTRTDLAGRSVLQYRLAGRQKTTVLWVDPQTKLPVRIESEQTNPFPDVSKLRSIYTNFEWDPQGVSPAQLFSTDPPAGYTLQDHTQDRVAKPAPQPAAKRSPTGAKERPLLADGPESARVIQQLGEVVPMQFPNQLPLVDALDYIKQATTTPTQPGIPYAWDEAELKRVGQTPTALVSIMVEDEPLRVTLPRLLEPLGLTFDVRKGILTITAEPR